MHNKWDTRHTQVLYQSEHDPSDMEVSFDSKASLNLEVCDVYLEFPRTISNHVAVGEHGDVGEDEDVWLN